MELLPKHTIEIINCIKLFDMIFDIIDRLKSQSHSSQSNCSNWQNYKIQYRKWESWTKCVMNQCYPKPETEAEVSVEKRIMIHWQKALFFLSEERKSYFIYLFLPICPSFEIECEDE